VHDRLGDLGRPLLDLVLHLLAGVRRVYERADALHDLERGQLLHARLGLDVVEGQLFPVHLHADVIVRQPTRRRVEHVFARFESRYQHPEEGYQEEQPNEIDRRVAEQRLEEFADFASLSTLAPLCVRFSVETAAGILGGKIGCHGVTLHST